MSARDCIFIDAAQGTPEWALARCGRATASEFDSIIAKGQGKMRATYLRKLIAERLTGKPIEPKAYGKWAKNLDRGQEEEPYAKMAYSARARVIVNDVGFAQHPEILAGASPDGLVGEDGGVEAKSVIATTQLETIMSARRGEAYPPEHRAQIQGNLWITGRRWWDFVSYCPDMPTPALRLYICRVPRDDAYIGGLEAEVRVFLREVDTLVEQLMERK